MGKPNSNQLEVLRVLHRNIHCWEQTNDINSPTHTGDMGEDFTNLAERINNSEQAEELYKKMLEILALVQNVESSSPMVNILNDFKKLDK